MSQGLGIVLIIAGAVLLLLGIWLVQRPSGKLHSAPRAVEPVQGSLPHNPEAPGDNAPGPAGATVDTASEEEATATALLYASIEAAMSDGVLTPNEENLIRMRAQEAGEEPEALLRSLRKTLAEQGAQAEVELVDVRQKAGLDFERYVLGLFNQKFFTIERWAGDKFHDGRYAAENHDPDLQLRLQLAGQSYPLAVECKWRSAASGDFVQFATKKQLAHYKAFEEKVQVPTFIALGIGGTPAAPEQLCIIPIRAVQSPFLHKDNIQRFAHPVNRPLFFDQEKGRLGSRY